MSFVFKGSSSNNGNLTRLKFMSVALLVTFLGVFGSLGTAFACPTEFLTIVVPSGDFFESLIAEAAVDFEAETGVGTQVVSITDLSDDVMFANALASDLAMVDFDVANELLAQGILHPEIPILDLSIGFYVVVNSNLIEISVDLDPVLAFLDAIMAHLAFTSNTTSSGDLDPEEWNDVLEELSGTSTRGPHLTSAREALKEEDIKKLESKKDKDGNFIGKGGHWTLTKSRENGKELISATIQLIKIDKDGGLTGETDGIAIVKSEGESEDAFEERVEALQRLLRTGKPQNTNPVAEFTAEASRNSEDPANIEVIVDASQSFDVDGDIKEYAVEIKAEDGRVLKNLEKADSKETISLKKSADTKIGKKLTVKLTVKDNEGATASATKEITIAERKESE